MREFVGEFEPLDQPVAKLVVSRFAPVALEPLPAAAPRRSLARRCSSSGGGMAPPVGPSRRPASSSTSASSSHRNIDAVASCLHSTPLRHSTPVRHPGIEGRDFRTLGSRICVASQPNPQALHNGCVTRPRSSHQRVKSFGYDSPQRPFGTPRGQDAGQCLRVINPYRYSSGRSPRYSSRDIPLAQASRPSCHRPTKSSMSSGDASPRP